MKEVELIDLLKQYQVCKKFLDSQAYAKDYFDPYDEQCVAEKEVYEARLRAIESLIKLLAPSDEYTVLYLHYIKGLSIEKCAESMRMSSRTAYRLLGRSYKYICKTINEIGEPYNKTKEEK